MILYRKLQDKGLSASVFISDTAQRFLLVIQVSPVQHFTKVFLLEFFSVPFQASPEPSFSVHNAKKIKKKKKENGAICITNDFPESTLGCTFIKYAYNMQ